MDISQLIVKATKTMSNREKAKFEQNIKNFLPEVIVRAAQEAKAQNGTKNVKTNAQKDSGS